MSYTKHTLLSTLSAVAMLTAASTASFAFSPFVTNMGMLKTHRDWNVGAVTMQNLKKYCAMVNKFDEGVTLAFARSPDGLGSLAINFAGRVLDAGKNYDVTLQVDDNETRQYTVNAANASSIVIQIGQDEAFYTTLGGNGVLHVDFSSLTMDFMLEGFASSYISLVSCADRLPRDTATKTAAAAPPPASSGDVGPRTEAQPVASVEKADLPPQTAQQQPVPSTVPPSLNAAANNQSAEGGSEAEVSKLAAQISGTTTAPIALTADAKTVQTKAAEEPRVRPVTLQEQVDLVRKFADESRAAQEESRSLKDKLDKTLQEQDNLKSKIDVLNQEKEVLSARAEMQEKQKKALEAALAEKEKNLENVRSVSIEDNKTLTTTRRELDDIKQGHLSTLKEVQDKLAEKNEQYARLQNQFAELQGLQRETAQQALRVQAELDNARLTLTSTQDRLGSTERQSNSIFDSMRLRLETAQTQVINLQGQVNALTSEKIALTDRLAAEQRKNRDLQASLDERERRVVTPVQDAMKPASVNRPALSQSALSSRQPSSVQDKIQPVGGPALLPPSLQPAMKQIPSRQSSNISSGKEASAPAITSPIIDGDFSNTSVRSSFLTDVKSAPSSEGDNWDTIVIQ